MKKVICTLLIMLSTTIVFAEQYNFVDLLDMISHSQRIKSVNGVPVDTVINKILNRSPEYLNRAFYQKTILSAAASAGRVDLMKNFIKRGARVDLPETEIPMMEAAMYGRVNVIKYLLSLGNNPNKQHFISLQTPLMMSIIFHQDKAFELLLQQIDINPNLEDKSNRNALQIAFEYKYYDYCEKLLQKGAKPNKKLMENQEFINMFGKYVLTGDKAYNKIKNEIDKVLANISITYDFSC